MDVLKIEATVDTPAIEFDPENNVFEMSGRSYPEDTHTFYTPVLEWMEKYAESPNEETSFNINLQYFNSSSYKPIFDILTCLEKINQNGTKATVDWHYKKDDWDMKETGEEFAEVIEIPFSFHLL